MATCVLGFGDTIILPCAHSLYLPCAIEYLESWHAVRPKSSLFLTFGNIATLGLHVL